LVHRFEIRLPEDYVTLIFAWLSQLLPRKFAPIMKGTVRAVLPLLALAAAELFPSVLALRRGTGEGALASIRATA
jgi:hypothetical protein